MAVGFPFRSRYAVPEITAELTPALPIATETLPTKSLTGFPETSRTEITGWVTNSDRLTASEAAVVSTN